MDSEKKLRESPSQTAGPYVHIGLTPNAYGISGVYETDLGASRAEQGTNLVKLDLRVFDGLGAPVTDVLIELWHADGDGNYATSAAPGEPDGWARGVCAPDDDTVRFEIIKPGACAPVSAPHINVWIAARGINLALNTRIYFPDENNDTDPVLALLEDDRRESLIARKVDGGYALDIHLQGEQETVFFDT